MKLTLTSAHLRWIIAGTLLLSTVINYTDRVTLSVLIPSIEKDLHLDAIDYSQIVSIFLFAYAAMYAVSGYLVDRWGPRRSLSIFSFTWSVSQMLHAFARGKLSLAGFRFALGMAEPGNFPAAVSAIREWFPVEQRALGVGIFNAGSSLGAALAPPLAGYIAMRYGWRSAFAATGLLGLCWLVLWRIVYHPVSEHPWLSKQERLAAALEIPDETVSHTQRWHHVLRDRSCLLLMLGRFLTDPVIYFVIFWLPSYLSKARGFGLPMIVRYAWVPYVFGDVGYVFGGWLSGMLVKRGWNVARARKLALILGACMLPVAIVAPRVTSIHALIMAMCFIVFGHSIWIANLLTLPADLFEQHRVGTVSGLSGMAGSVGGIITTLAIGYVTTRFSFRPIFLVAGIMHPLSAAILVTFLPEQAAGDRPAIEL